MSELPRLSQYKWRLSASEREGWSQVRARIKRVIGQRSEVLLHRLVMQAVQVKSFDIGYGNGLDCRKENLVRCTASDRSRGQAAHRDKRTSKYKGVYFDKPSSNFTPSMIDGKRKNLSRGRQSTSTPSHDGPTCTKGEPAVSNLLALRLGRRG
jgi:hypothetical protein